MTAPLTLYYAPDNASLCVRLLLLAQGRAFETKLVDRATSAQKSPAYLAKNPNGLIPVLVTPEGTMFETGAILFWLHGQPMDTNALKWLFWLSNTLHPTARMVFYPHQYAPETPDAMLRNSRARFGDHLTILENAADADWLDDPAHPNACYLAPLLRWCGLYGADPDPDYLAQWPKLLDFARKTEVTPHAIAAACAEGLGPTPFSRPSAPNPPEGSAT